MTTRHEMPANGSRLDDQARRRLLKERARALGWAPPEEREPRTDLEVIVFIVGGERYAAEVRCVREVCPVRDLVPLPCTPPFVAGIVNVRGEVVTMIDLNVFFELPEKGPAEITEALVVQAGDMTFGILADRVSGMRSIPLAGIQPLLAALPGVRAPYVRGIMADETIVLDVVRIAADRRLIVDEDVGGDAGGAAQGRDVGRPAMEACERPDRDGGAR